MSLICDSHPVDSTDDIHFASASPKFLVSFLSADTQIAGREFWRAWHISRSFFQESRMMWMFPIPRNVSEQFL